MWKLNKPDINVAKGKDIDELINHSYILKRNTDLKERLITLYQYYDNQNGRVTDKQLEAISQKEAEQIFNSYPKTYKGECLNYIRIELNKNVHRCPYCSISELAQLDHNMPESKYKALAVCRMNLVPMCGICNNKKNDNNYSNFIHCYYQEYPANTQFFVADISVVENRFVVNFHFTGIDDSLNTKLSYQAITIDLFERLQKEASVYIENTCKECYATTIEGFREHLELKYETEKNTWGLNDWRTVVIKGMIDCPNLDISVVNNYKNNPRDLSGGGV